MSRKRDHKRKVLKHLGKVGMAFVTFTKELDELDNS